MKRYVFDFCSTYLAMAEAGSFDKLDPISVLRLVRERTRRIRQARGINKDPILAWVLLLVIFGSYSAVCILFVLFRMMVTGVSNRLLRVRR